MRRTAAVALILSLLMLLAGCDDATNPSNDTFTDKLTLGTGMSGFNITGETTAFHIAAASVTIYWRLESNLDIGGSQVRIRMESISGGVYTPVDSASYGNPQTYGHIMVSSYPWTRTGAFRAVGIIQSTGRVVGTKEFAVH
ncbi:MAG: hypothetical protein HZB25_13005 [Candidatus Eisenbacteria bacterium]|nr:hypothetical protein [Candidatus Eisenbacteria bacterium]